MAAKKKSAAKSTGTRPKGRDALAVLEELNGGPLTFGQLLNAIRVGEEWSLSDMGHRLGVSRNHVHDVENGRRAVSPERAVKWASILGYPEWQFVQLALQAELDRAALDFAVLVQTR